ncbi:hypothetical protein TNCV_204141 [Trichonephila clavipes]|nr:hypothetical protein TNCV_204141 [Trichonephila clavipes]
MRQEVAFDWLDPDEREAERSFGWALKENRVEPLCTQYKVEGPANALVNGFGVEGRGLPYFCHNDGWKTLKKNPSMEPRPFR